MHSNLRCRLQKRFATQGVAGFVIVGISCLICSQYSFLQQD